MHKEIIGGTEFIFKSIEPHEIHDDIFRLRYQVYCNECKFIKESDYPDGIERDEYDPFSLHFVAKDEHGLIGAARLILESPLGFPIEEHCNHSLSINLESIHRHKIAEISRLVISKLYRRRVNDGLYYDKSYKSALNNIHHRFRPMTFGLFREIYQESKRRGITHWYTLMEKSLHSLLRMHGFVFKPIGNEIDFYGQVGPYIAKIKDIERSVIKKKPVLFEFFAN